MVRRLSEGSWGVGDLSVGHTFATFSSAPLGKSLKVLVSAAAPVLWGVSLLSPQKQRVGQRQGLWGGGTTWLSILAFPAHQATHEALG